MSYDEQQRVPLSGNPPTTPTGPTPVSEKHPDGQARDHWVLSAEERAKGFVRPVRTRYQHVGRPPPRFPLLDITAEQRTAMDTDKYVYVKYERYPESESPRTGRYWTQAEIDSIGRGCGVVTRQPLAIAETYARDPTFYGQTFCCGCNKYLPVGELGEFVWCHERTGEPTTERVGS